MLSVLLLLLVAAASAQAGDPAVAVRLTGEAQEFYRKGSFGEALLKFEEAVKAGAEGGELFYQMGYCYKTVRQDAALTREYMAKAVPLLEKTVADPALSSPTPFYYLSTALSIELGDFDKGADVARRGIALAEKGAFKDIKDGEALFQIGRLYSIASQHDKAIGWYEKAMAALDAGKVTNRPYLVASAEQLSKAYMKNQDYEKAVVWLQRLVELEPQREEEKFAAGGALVRVGRYKEAIQILRGFNNDDLATEANYTVRVLSRYGELGSPALPAEKSKLDDAALFEETRKAAVKLGEIRSKDEASAPEPPPAEMPYEWVTGKKGMKRKVPIRPSPPPGWQPKDPDNPTQEERDIMAGVWIPPKRVVPPPSAERLAAEKEFFGLLVEDLRRGHLLREKAVINGFASLIFR